MGGDEVDGEPADAPGAVLAAAAQLAEYFAGDRRVFDVPVDLSRLGAFQRQVLDLTVAIPYGGTRAYGELAVDLGDRSWCGPSEVPSSTTRWPSSSRATGWWPPTAP